METALKEAGTCGRFQVYHVIFTQLPRFVTAWGIMLMMFGSYDPGWRCIVDGRVKAGVSRNGHYLAGHEYGRSKNASYLEYLDNGLNSTDSLDDGTSNWTLRGDGTDYLYNDTCDVIQLCDDIEFDPASITIVSEFQLVCDRKWIVKMILLVMSVGFLVGALCGGQIGEKFGRKISLFTGSFVMFVFSGLAIFSYHWVMYTICLFFVCCGGNLIQSTSSIFSMEFLNSKWRSIFGSIPTWNLSLCVFTFATAAMKSWVHVHIVTCLLSFLACIGYFILSESVRWLVIHGKYKEAERVIQKVARLNQKPFPSSRALLKLKEETKSEEKSSTTTYTYLHLFKTKNLAVLTVKFSTIFFVVFITYFSLGFGVNSLPGDFYINAISSSMCEIFVVLLTGPLCNKIGRRWSGSVMSLLGAVSCAGIVVALFTVEGEVQSTTIKACAFLARSGSMAISVVATIFMAELFPTAVRNVAFGMFRAMAGIGGLVGPFLIPTKGVESFAMCFSLMAVSFISSLLIFLSLSETNKLGLLDRIGESRTIVVEGETKMRQLPDNPDST